MDLSRVVLAVALTTLAVGLLVWAIGRPILGIRVRYTQAAAAGVLMAVGGSLAAALLGGGYLLVRPWVAGAVVRKVRVLGWWVSLDVGLVWLVGLGAGYVAGLWWMVGGRGSRRLLVAMLAAAATPALLMGAEWGIGAAGAMLRGAVGR